MFLVRKINLLRELIKQTLNYAIRLSYWLPLVILKPLMMLYHVCGICSILRFDDGTPHYAQLDCFLSMILELFFTEATNIECCLLFQEAVCWKLNFQNRLLLFHIGTRSSYQLLGVISCSLSALINNVSFGIHTLVIIPLFIEILFLSLGFAFIPIGSIC